MKKTLMKQMRKWQRKKRVRARITGTSDCPRLSVYRSLNFIYAQLIDDATSVTMVAVNDKDGKWEGNKTQRAQKVGEEIAKQAQAKGINTIVFDRGSHAYHGRVKALAEAARAGGLKF